MACFLWRSPWLAVGLGRLQDGKPVLRAWDSWKGSVEREPESCGPCSIQIEMCSSDLALFNSIYRRVLQLQKLSRHSFHGMDCKARRQAGNGDSISGDDFDRGGTRGRQRTHSFGQHPSVHCGMDDCAFPHLRGIFPRELLLLEMLFGMGGVCPSVSAA